MSVILNAAYKLLLQATHKKKNFKRQVKNFGKCKVRLYLRPKLSFISEFKKVVLYKWNQL